MAHKIKSLLSVLGLATWGDIGPFTVYRNKRGRLIWFPKAPPNKPASPAQLHYRNLWRQAACAWRHLPDAYKIRWELATQRCSLTLTGYNMFLYWWCTHDDEPIRTLEHRLGFDLLYDRDALEAACPLPE